MYSSIAYRLLLGLLSTAPAWAACPSIDWGWKASLIQQSSQWHELDAGGARLVHEHANLPGWELATNLRCAAWEFGASWQQLAGNRAYDGQTSDGVLVQSQSDWSQQHMRFDIHYDVTPNWAAGVRVTDSTMHRILQGNAQAARKQRSRFRGNHRTQILAPVPDRGEQFLRAHQRPGSQVAVAAQILGGAVDDEIRDLAINFREERQNLLFQFGDDRLVAVNALDEQLQVRREAMERYKRFSAKKLATYLFWT
jgi:hypothetical protein